MPISTAKCDLVLGSPRSAATMLRACGHVGIKTRFHSDPWSRLLNTRICIRPSRPLQPSDISLRAHSTEVDVVVVGGGHAGMLVYRLAWSPTAAVMR